MDGDEAVSSTRRSEGKQCSNHFCPARSSACQRPQGDWYVNLARHWSGQRSLSTAPDGSVQWDSQTRLEVGEDRWQGAPPRMEFSIHNALVPLGNIESVSAFAFVCPISVIAASFRNTLPKYVDTNIPGTRIVDFALKLDEILADSNAYRFLSIEGIDQSGFQVIIRPEPSSFSLGLRSVPLMKELYAVEIDAFDHPARLTENYGRCYTSQTQALRLG